MSFTDKDRDGRKAPSPESRRRARANQLTATAPTMVEEGDSVFAAVLPSAVAASLPGSGRSRLTSTTMYQDEEDEFGFLETKPIMADPFVSTPQKSKKGSSAQDEDILSFADDGLNEEEPRYFKESRGPSRAPLRALRPGTEKEDSKRNDDIRRHFLRRHGDRKASDVPSDLLEKSDLAESFRAMNQVAASPNPPGVDEKIESFLEELKQAKPRTGSLAFANAMPNSESLMQAWPADMERLLRSPESLLANLDCTLEEYTDILCALFGIPVYESRIEALHQLFTLFVDFKEIST